MNLLAKILRLFIKPKNKQTKNEKSISPEKILVFKSGAIGDIIWTTPFLKHLRKKYPKAHITYCVGSWSSEILKNNPNINKIIEIDDAKLVNKDFLYTLSLIKKIKEEKFDIAFTFEKHYLSNMFIWATKIPIKVGFDRFGEGFPLDISVPYGNEKHEIEYDLDLLLSIDAKQNHTKKDYIKTFGNDYYRPQVFPTKKEANSVEKIFKKNKLKGRIVGICPGGGKNTIQDSKIRRWPLEKYVELSEKLLEKKYIVILIGGPSDVEMAERFSKKCVNLIGMLNIKETIIAMSKCNYIICNDSGPMNMASAANPQPKIVSLFGPTRPDRKAPLGKNSISIWKDADIYYPKYDLFGEIKHNLEFMKKINVSDVLEKIK